MAFLLQNLPASPPLLHQSKSNDKLSPPVLPPLLPQAPPPQSLLSPSQLSTNYAILSSRAKSKPTGAPENKQKEDFYVNLGLSVRTLREDLPQLFTKELNYDIYRDDITLTDPLNKFTGIANYKLVFWALRFHGRILFRDINLEVLRIWQPSENMILIRWNLRGIPRVPWEAKGEFQGTSRYKLDRHGKIYEHRVDNLAFNLPQQLKPAVSVLDLVVATPASPNLTCLFAPVEAYSSSWVEFYRAVKDTLDCHDQRHLVLQDGLLSCS